MAGPAADLIQGVAALLLQHAEAPVVVAAFEEAVVGSGTLWWALEGQQRFRSDVLQHPAAARFPLPVTKLHAVVRLFLARAEAAGAAHPAQCGEDGWECDEELVGDLIALQAGTNPFRGPAAEEAPAGTVADLFKVFLLPPAYTAAGDGDWAVVPMRVGPQFTNVGLSMWPAAFVLVDYLRASVLAKARWAAALPPKPRAVELGAGVGFTGPALAALGGAPSTFFDLLTHTDYQPEIIANCDYNLALAASVAPPRPGPVTRSAAALLDWTETEHNEALLQGPLQCDVLLAADVLYDRVVLEPLARTIVAGLRGARDPATAVCVMVATHRNAETVAEFLAAVQGECTVETEPFTTFAAVSLANVVTPPAQPSGDVPDHAPALCGPFRVEMPGLSHIHLLRLARPHE